MSLQVTIYCKRPGLTCCPYKIQTDIPADNVMMVEIWCTNWKFYYSTGTDDQLFTPTICKCEEKDGV
jgi:hypothetical protein